MMESLYDFINTQDIITESKSPTSDNAIWYRLGIHKYKWAANANRREKWNKKYNIGYYL